MRRTVQDRIDGLLSRRFPTAEVMNQQELKQNQEDQINPLLGLVYALLSLAIVVSLFGIANTLALSIYERTRELGMLRAIGMSRRQVRRMIRYESVITALIGAVLGMILGLIFAALLSVPLQDQGFSAQLPRRPARLHPGRRRARRGAGGDRPGPPCRPARRASGAGVRVAQRPSRAGPPARVLPPPASGVTRIAPSPLGVCLLAVVDGVHADRLVVLRAAQRHHRADGLEQDEGHPERVERRRPARPGPGPRAELMFP